MEATASDLISSDRHSVFSPACYRHGIIHDSDFQVSLVVQKFTTVSTYVANLNFYSLYNIPC